MAQTARIFEAKPDRRLNYWLYQPETYPERHSWPVILFLHGSGERGDDIQLVKNYGLTKYIDTRPDFPFVVVSPQCPAETRWIDHLPVLNMLLDNLLLTLNVDSSRVYLTGLSMGGQGVWYLGAENAERFAAVAPICGRTPPAAGYPAKVCALRETPVWVFHGDKDDLVPIQESERMVTALKSCGGDVQFTIFPGVGHNSWDLAYNDPALYDWFLQHTKT